MRRPFVLGPAATGIALLIAGCGSSGTTTTKAAAPPTTSAAAQTTSAAQATTGAASSSSAGVVVATKHDKLGTVLAAGSKRLTVYMFEGDKGSTSSCTGPCSAVWPPVTTASGPTAGGSAIAADLGTITRSDGTMQVTYKGHPLYFFAKDGDSGDAYGQGVHGFGSDWYVLAPSGKKVDKS